MDADHRLVIGEVRWKRKPKMRKLTRERYMLENLKEKKKQFDEQINERRMNVDMMTEVGVEEMWSVFKERLDEVAKQTIGIKKITMGGTKKTAWWNDEMKSLVRRKNKCFREWMQNRTEEKRQRYVEARNISDNTRKRLKKESWTKIGVDLENDMKGTRKLIYGLAKKYRTKVNNECPTVLSKNGERLVEEEEIDERWEEYFRELLNVQGGGEEEGERELDEIEQENDENLITREEVRAALSVLKNGKSPGIDGIPAELLKTGPAVVG